MRRRMESELLKQDDPRMRGEGDVFERYPFSHPWLSDYYERYMRRHETGECMEPGWIEPTDIEPPDAFEN
jgi:hypothetical protein